MRTTPVYAKPIINDLEIVEKAGALKWIKPVNASLVSSSFGTRINPIKGNKEFHNGIDIGAKAGTPVVAIENGKIIETGVSPTWGKYIKYEINDGYTIFYAHLSSVLVKEGEQIIKEQTVAKIGSTGLSTGPHLHLTIYKGKKEIDPLLYFDYKLSSGAKLEYIYRGEPVPEGY